MQYLQSYIQEFVNNTFNNETHLPSGVQLWHMPAGAAFPIPPFLFFLSLPLDEQDTSYFAESDNILIFSIRFIKYTSIVSFYYNFTKVFQLMQTYVRIS
ncbi:hypothetical protein SDC9_172838 [bioreactor metagenome]|uniref:Uncharacterized protein n=1 Tax=bioreactor metagenome TaxID=1076179 RepID=A0A645GI19_9ZZZZ